MNLGVDIGGVIMAPVVGGRADTSFLSGGLEQALATPASPGAVECLRSLVELFDARVWLISKAGKTVRCKTLRWLDHHDFYARTGLPPANVRFCYKRHEKAGHCEALAITHFVDDRLDVLTHLRGVVPRLYLFGEQRPGVEAPEWVEPVADWPMARDAVTGDLSAG